MSLSTSVLAIAAFVATFTAATPTLPVNVDANAFPAWYLSQVPFTSKYAVSAKPSAQDVAVGRYNASFEALGWDYLHIKPQSESVKKAPSRAGAYYSAGYLEGHLTAERVLQAHKVQVQPAVAKQSACQTNWVNEHIAYITGQLNELGAEDAFWHQVGCLFQQLQGIADGATAGNAAGATLTFLDVFNANFADEIGDVATYCALNVSMPITKLPPRDSHCSALIKPTATDLYMAHDTWTDFPAGLTVRFFKVYEFQTTVSMSAWPATIASGDDWYMTSNQIAVQETTNGVMNTEIFKAVLPNTVSEFARVMTATYLANDGATWTTLFARENSGTYNNQYMVVDFKLYSPGSTIIANTLWVAEQLPGVVVRADVSDVLRTQGFWASYNIPYFPEIYELSGYAAMYAKQGNFWSYSKYARAEIFGRNAPNVSKIQDMQHMMRYNDYETDKFSIISNCGAATGGKCSPDHSSMLTIASRGDLMPFFATSTEMTAHYGELATYMAQGCFGAVDSKIAAWSQRHQLGGTITAGPTNDQQSIFEWKNSQWCQGRAMQGSVDKYDFPWVQFKIGKINSL